MTVADTWNSLYAVGMPVVVYPAGKADGGVATVTRSPAWTLGHGAAVVSVEGYSGGIALTHIEVICGSRCPVHPEHVCLRQPHDGDACWTPDDYNAMSCKWAPLRGRLIPRRGELHTVLLAAVERSSDADWTVGRAKRLFHRDCGFTHILRSTIRRELAALHAEGHLVAHETPGRRFYTPAKDGAQ
jgi:hypothetical protein